MNSDELTSATLPKGYVQCPDGSITHKSRLTGFQHRDRRETSKLEPNPENGNLGTLPIQAQIGRPFLVRVKAFRRRLLDEDNLCEKYVVDLCRYAGALPSDAAGKAKIEVTQEKVGQKEREFVRIEIFKS